MKDELDELFVREDELIDKKMLKEILLKYLRLTDKGEVIPENEFHNLPNTKKVILFLLARKVLKIKEILTDEEIGPTEISNSIGIASGSVKTVFHATKDNIFYSINGKYKIPNYAIKKVGEILVTDSAEAPIIKTKAKYKQSNIIKIHSASKKFQPTSRIEVILKKINRTDYPNIHLLASTRDKSLYLLKIIKDLFDIDGLTVQEIGYILTEIFRIPTSKESISMALMDSKEVTRYREDFEGKSVYVYRLMQPGEEYLGNILANINKNK